MTASRGCFRQLFPPNQP